MTKVFLSSTFVDLEAYRTKAIEVCKRLGLDPIGMEYFNSQSAGATEGCKRELDKADLYVGFYAHRYGYVEDAADGRSVTEIEFDYAGERGIDRICFVVDPKFAWPQEHIDYKNHDKQESFKNDKVSKLIRKEFTTIDNFAMLLNSALSQWKEQNDNTPPPETHISSSTSSAIFATRPDHLREKPRVFIGRDDLFNQAYALLEAHQPVLLQGFGGMGKTALAAALAARWLENHKADSKKGVLWLKAGSAGVDALFEALARPFNQEKAIASQTGDAKITAVNDLLYGCGASLLVLDDCWSGPDLFALLEAVPDDLPVLITARQRYPINGEILHVDELSDTDALALLNQHARNQSSTPSVGAQGLAPIGNQTVAPSATPSVGAQHAAPSALDLCHLLGNHAFAIEIAGKTLKAHNWTSADLKAYTWTPADLIAQIKDAPDKLTMPLELSEAGRENVAKLLEVSLNALDDAARNTFLAFGAFFAPQLTPEMLMRYFVGTPEISDEQLVAIRAQNPQLPSDMADSKLRQLVQKSILDNANPEPAQKALDTLHLHGLVERLPATDTTITAYRVHDLAYSYVRTQTTDAQRQRALQACLSYTQHYNQPSLPNFAALRPELDNFLGAASWAFDHQYFAEVEQFAWNLYANSQFLNYAGFSSEATHLLSLAAQAAEYVSSKRDQAAHLGNLGNAYRDLGQVESAINYHQQALDIAREIGDKRSEGVILGNLGDTYRDLGHVTTAIDYNQQALNIAREIGDKGNEGIQLGNLGSAFFSSGQHEKAIDYYQQALNIAREIGDKGDESNWLSGLGISYQSLEETEKAIDYYRQALEVAREIGDKRVQGNQLGNLGAAYDDLKDYPSALDYYQQARTIFAEIGAQHRVAQTDRNIAKTQRKMSAASPDTPDASS